MIMTTQQPFSHVLLLAGDFSYLLQLGAIELGRSFGVSVPEIKPSPPDSAISASASLRVSDTVGLQQIAVGLQGSFTAGGMARKIGLPWPLADDLITISEPRVVYTVVPASFLLEAVLDIPLLRVHRHVATVVVQPGGNVELKVGACRGKVQMCGVQEL
jgi:hypothetical protein